jgi:hypothetical protein
LSADKQNDRALAMADPLLKDADLDGPSSFELAVLYIGSAAAADEQKMPAQKQDRAPLVSRRIEQGVRLLQRANEAHFFADPSSRKKLHSAPFVPLLSANAAFQKLLLTVEKKPPLPEPAAAK